MYTRAKRVGTFVSQTERSSRECRRRCRNESSAHACIAIYAMITEWSAVPHFHPRYSSVKVCSTSPLRLLPGSPPPVLLAQAHQQPVMVSLPAHACSHALPSLSSVVQVCSHALAALSSVMHAIPMHVLPYPHLDLSMHACMHACPRVTSPR